MRSLQKVFLENAKKILFNKSGELIFIRMHTYAYTLSSKELRSQTAKSTQLIILPLFIMMVMSTTLIFVNIREMYKGRHFRYM